MRLRAEIALPLARMLLSPPRECSWPGRNAERKQEVQKAAQEAAETGTAMETGLTADKTVPDGIQRGRNSRTGPLSNKE